MNLRLVFRFIEASLLFIALPVIFYIDLLPVRKIVALLLVTGICAGILWIDKSYDFRRLTYRPNIPGMAKKLLTRGGLVAVAVFVLTMTLEPDRLLMFPRREPMIWGIVMLLYPVLSALPQELIYREFFFHRYQDFVKPEWLLVTASACSFSFLHIIYDNEWALLLSLIGGFLFARTYQETRSLYWVSVEHALYGCIIFTIGMGNYFYEPF
ncbi:MAG: CPBP family intramembrane metalloprotease [Balneolaceae bacterium]|nr:CPBP family intramembrane metalloprotease [Balneolaceae bacterium]